MDMWRALLVLGLAGCGEVPIPFDTAPLVVVDIDPAFYGHRLVSVDDAGHDGYEDEGFLVRRGVHYWDVMGVHLVPDGELTEEQRAISGEVAHLKITRSDLDIGNDTGGVAWPGTREITIYAPVAENSFFPRFPALIAHELGHAMGLNHVSDTSAIMNEAPATYLDINVTDATEMRGQWPSLSMPSPVRQKNPIQ